MDFWPELSTCTWQLVIICEYEKVLDTPSDRDSYDMD